MFVARKRGYLMDIFLHQARHRIDEDDVLSKIDVLMNWEAILCGG
jgi:hypothetical protein